MVPFIYTTFLLSILLLPATIKRLFAGIAFLIAMFSAIIFFVEPAFQHLSTSLCHSLVRQIIIEQPNAIRSRNNSTCFYKEVAKNIQVPHHRYW